MSHLIQSRRIISQIQHGVTIDGEHLDLVGFLVDAGDDDSVASYVLIAAHISGIDPQKGDVAVVSQIGIHLRVDADEIRIKFDPTYVIQCILYYGQPCCDDPADPQNQDQYDDQRDLQAASFFLFLLSFFGTAVKTVSTGSISVVSTVSAVCEESIFFLCFLACFFLSAGQLVSFIDSALSGDRFTIVDFLCSRLSLLTHLRYSIRRIFYRCMKSAGTVKFLRGLMLPTVSRPVGNVGAI